MNGGQQIAFALHQRLAIEFYIREPHIIELQ